MERGGGRRRRRRRARARRQRRWARKTTRMTRRRKRRRELRRRKRKRREEEEKEETDEEEEQEDEEREDEEELEEEIPAFDDGAHALWVMRKTFEMLDDGLSILSEEDPPRPPQVPLLPPKEDIFQMIRSHDSVEYVRNSRIHHHGHSGLMDVDRGYESA